MAAEYPYKISMLPVKHGDCFFLEFGNEKNAFRMLIDGGPSGGKEELFKHLEPLARQNQQIDVLIVTHYDGDHIEGVLKLLEEPRYSALVKEVWHNGLKEIAPNLRKHASGLEEKVYKQVIGDHYMAPLPDDCLEDGEEEISEKQSLQLAMLLDQQHKTVNSITGGQAINAETPDCTLGPSKDVEVFFLLPEQKALDRLLKEFRAELEKKCPNSDATLTAYCREAFDYFMHNVDEPECGAQEIGFEHLTIDQIPKLAAGPCNASDSSHTNKASIAFIIRYHGKKFLFPGDAHASPLVKALKAWQKKTGENLHFDVIKLPHHGSKSNCFRLLKMPNLDGDVFLVSTNGDIFDHPDAETLAKVICRGPGPQPRRRLLFNYDSEAYAFFHNNEAQKTYNYTAEYCCTITDAEGETDDKDYT